MTNDTTGCVIDDCGRKIVGRKMCSMHWSRWRNSDASISGECSIDDCSKPARTRGWCSAHYQRWQKFGDAAHPVDERKATKIVDLDNGDRVCGQCGSQKRIEEFHKDSRGKRGRRGQCAQCELENQKSYYLANQERIVARQAAYRRDDPDHVRNLDNMRYLRDKAKRIELATQHAQVRRARILGREVDQGITVLRLRKLYGDDCPYCTQTMTFTPGKRGDYNPLRASIEHLLPISKGGTHTWDNVILACLGCNLSRGNREAVAAVQPALILPEAA